MPGLALRWSWIELLIVSIVTRDGDMALLFIGMVDDPILFLLTLLDLIRGGHQCGQPLDAVIVDLLAEEEASNSGDHHSSDLRGNNRNN